MTTIITSMPIASKRLNVFNENKITHPNAATYIKTVGLIRYIITIVINIATTQVNILSNAIQIKEPANNLIKEF